MKMFIPPLGTVLVLQEHWEFTLHSESRNLKFYDEIWALGEFRPKQSAGDVIYGYYRNFVRDRRISMRMATLLQVDRYYIRQNKSDYDSVTFKIVGRKNCRFWAELQHVNEMRYEVVPREQVERLVIDWQELRQRQAREAAEALSPVQLDPSPSAQW